MPWHRSSPAPSPGGSQGASPLGTRAGAQHPSPGRDPPGSLGAAPPRDASSLSLQVNARCSSPALLPLMITRHGQHLCLERSVFPSPVEREGSLSRSTGQGCGPTSGCYLPAFALSLSPPPSLAASLPCVPAPLAVAASHTGIMT